MSTLPPIPASPLRPKTPFRVHAHPESAGRTRCEVRDASDAAYGFSYDGIAANVIADALNAFFQSEPPQEPQTMLQQLTDDRVTLSPDTEITFFIVNHGSIAAKLLYIGKDFLKIKTAEHTTVFRIDQIVGYSI